MTILSILTAAGVAGIGVIWLGLQNIRVIKQFLHRPSQESVDVAPRHVDDQHEVPEQRVIVEMCHVRSHELREH